MIVQVNFYVKWRLKNNPNYVWTNCKRLVNAKTGHIIKKTTNGNGSQPGYWINKCFIKIQDLREGNLLELIKENPLPF